RSCRLNVTAEDLRAYIEVFHRTLEDCARQFLPEENRFDLFHLSLLPARITGYVSTQFGVGIEYEQAAETSINVIRGSVRVEDLFFRLPSRVRRLKPRFIINAAPILFQGFTMSGESEYFPLRLAKDDASISLVNMTFEVGPWKRV